MLLLVVKGLARAVLRPAPHPLAHSAGVAVPAAADVPRDESALLHISPDPSAALTHAKEQQHQPRKI